MSEKKRRATARSIAAWAQEFAGLGVPVYLNDETPGDPSGPWDFPTEAAHSLAQWLWDSGLLDDAEPEFSWVLDWEEE